MKITEVRIKLTEPTAGGRPTKLLGYCSVTFDNCLAVYDMRIICLPSGRVFVAFPSRSLNDHCPGCGHRNDIRSRFCHVCGTMRAIERASLDENGRAKLYIDVVHPIDQGFRQEVEKEILDKFRAEQELAKQPGYVCTFHKGFSHEEETNLPG